MGIDISVLTGVLGIDAVSSAIERYYRRWTDPSAGIRELNELIEDAEKERADSGRGELLPAFVQELRNERDERQAYYVVYKRLIGDRKAVDVPGAIVQSLICMTFIGMVLPATAIAMFDLGDENRAFPILFTGLLLGLAVLLLCVPVSRGRRISEIFDRYSSTEKGNRHEPGANPAWDENDVASIVEKARRSKGRYETPRWVLGVTMSVMTGIVVCYECKCGVYIPEIAMFVASVDSIAFLVALAFCVCSYRDDHLGGAKVGNTSGSNGRENKSSIESRTSNRNVGTGRASKVGKDKS